MTATCISLWIGPALGAIERACILSALRVGHPFVLYCYRPPAHVPDGVELRDAAEVIPEDRIIRHRTGSAALFANRFRYELQRRGLGTWIDLDAYLLKPLDGDAPYLFGEYEPGRFNNAVLRLPPDSPLLPPLLELFEEKTVPPWLPWRATVAARWRLWRHGRSDLSQMPWGSAGPLALTHLVHAHGLSGLGLPQEVLYPVPWQEADWIRDPARPLETVISDRTTCIHVWNERIKAFKNEPAPPGSFLARLQREGAC